VIVAPSAFEYINNGCLHVQSRLRTGETDDTFSTGNFFSFLNDDLDNDVVPLKQLA
jgi:hypothetical protein